MSTVIVTGANGGIGKAVVKKLLSEGKHVSAVARNISSLEDDLYKRENCSLYECDFTDENSIANMVKNIVDENSGVGGVLPLCGL